jgi:hypothetical protein
MDDQVGVEGGDFAAPGFEEEGKMTEDVFGGNGGGRRK